MELKKPKCMTQKIWNKLDKSQRKRWADLYKDFYAELNALSHIDNVVKAHNLALLAVWYKASKWRQLQNYLKTSATNVDGFDSRALQKNKEKS